ncbi:hypothetical protein TNCV_3269631 [Trichonephila clavipes]|nr:hypothetical protein TNCV_3269631 [Trichonephila clavipes]
MKSLQAKLRQRRGEIKFYERSGKVFRLLSSYNCTSDDRKIIKSKINPVESKLGVCDLKNIRGKPPTGENTTSLDERIKAMLQKSFRSDLEKNDNFQKDYLQATRTAYPSFFR